ncbi:MAG TPA: sigma factor-like helix-turn-helix DNA-binding protein [Armatimonadota bacterium]|jgi:DNA-directed RNA polymerase specialized sigma24 family protein
MTVCPQAPVASEYPFLSDHDLQRREFRRKSVCLNDFLAGLNPAEEAYLFASQLADLVDALRLPLLERAVLELRLQGRTIREIAALTGLKKWRVEQAIRRLRRAWRISRKASSPHQGWQSAYLSETQRGA